MKKALIIVDYQYDFVHPQGSLYIPNAEKLINKIQILIKKFHQENNFVIATKDWHPADHISFNIWNPHCIQNTKGAELYQIHENQLDKIILKGINKEIESYSGFFDEKNNSNNLLEYLQQKKVTEIMIVGVALDICVSATLCHAIKNNLHGTVNLECTVGITPNIIF